MRSRSRQRGWKGSSRCIVAALLLSAGASVATGAHAQPRIVVADFGGPGGSRIRAQVVRGLSDAPVELVAQDEMRAAARSLGVAPSSASDYGRVAAELRVRAFVEGTVSRSGRRFQCEVTVRGGDGEVAGAHAFTGRNPRALATAVRRQIWSRLGEAVESAPEPRGGAGSRPVRGAVSEVPTRVRGAVAEDVTMVVVRPLSGPGGGRARTGIVRALEEMEGVALLVNDDVESVAADVSADLSAAGGRVAVASELGIAAFVEGRVERISRRRYSAEVQVYGGVDGELLGEAGFTGRNPRALLRAIQGGLARELGDALRRAQAPVVEQQSEGEEEEEEESTPSGPAGPRPSPMTVAAGLRMFNRSYGYTDDLFGALRAYSLGIGPAASLALHWYPLAHVMDGPAADLGLDLRGETALFLLSKDSAGNEFPTSHTAWYAGLRWRIRSDPVVVTGVLGYGVRSYRIEAISVDVPAPEVPDVDYGTVRIGAEGRLSVLEGLLAFELHAAYLALLDTGQLAADEWFPRSSGGGLELGLIAGLRFAEDFELRAGVDLRRYFLSMNPEPGDPRIAGGALDQYIAGTVAISWTWPEAEAEEGYGDR